MFYLGGAQTPVAINLAAAQGVVIPSPFDTYFKGAALPAAVLVLLIPAVVYVIAKPEVTRTPWARKEARARLRARGRPRWREGLVIAVMLGAVGLWVSGGLPPAIWWFEMLVPCLMPAPEQPARGRCLLQSD